MVSIDEGQPEETAASAQEPAAALNQALDAYGSAAADPSPDTVRALFSATPARAAGQNLPVQDPAAAHHYHPSALTTLVYGAAQGETRALAPLQAAAMYSTTATEDSRLREAMDALRQAEDSESKAEAREQLRTALSEQYDQYIEAQREQLDSMAKRLQSLREQLDKREAAKERLVDLRLEMLENEANGLSWPSAEGTHFLGGQAYHPADVVSLGRGAASWAPGVPMVAPAASAQAVEGYPAQDDLMERVPSPPEDMEGVPGDHPPPDAAAPPDAPRRRPRPDRGGVR